MTNSKSISSSLISGSPHLSAKVNNKHFHWEVHFIWHLNYVEINHMILKLTFGPLEPLPMCYSRANLLSLAVVSNHQKQVFTIQFAIMILIWRWSRIATLIALSHSALRKIHIRDLRFRSFCSTDGSWEVSLKTLSTNRQRSTSVQTWLTSLRLLHSSRVCAQSWPTCWLSRKTWRNFARCSSNGTLTIMAQSHMTSLTRT